MVGLKGYEESRVSEVFRLKPKGRAIVPHYSVSYQRSPAVSTIHRTSVSINAAADCTHKP